ncbi:alkaline phosphatase family protein [Sulfurovum riftiae]|uniref:Nucleotide pyrophosphatase n=1 Tax=Sulfurovum riftiae TaxID=1630136 RepID=A0A151CJD9_9BACT|nr:alkaline phosphatase family protein [Sulfurovum riftiae]KYJ87631.1 hypothetical protein AS592_11070 [Sulfurovum riftiae]
MQKKVVAISIDSFSANYFEPWLKDGKLPVLRSLQKHGAYGPINKPSEHPHDNSWLSFYQGVWPHKSGEWGHQNFDPKTYTYKESPVHKANSFQPFFAMYPDLKVVIFDAPHLLPVKDVNGVQIHGWGLEANQYQPKSEPPERIEEILEHYGPHPLFSSESVRKVASDDKKKIYSTRIPSIYDYEALKQVTEQAILGIKQRTKIILDLIKNEEWDFFFSTIGELHYASHLLWHLNLDHPLHDHMVKKKNEDLLLQVAQAVDEAVGIIIEHLPVDSNLFLFSVSGMRSTYTETNNHLLLPEFLYRWQFGRAALAEGDISSPVSPPSTHFHRHWKDEVWSLRTIHGENDLESPSSQEAKGDPMDWSPANWYRPLWPRMKAFSLPNYSHGMIRINLEEREGEGKVNESEYEQVCDDIEKALLKLTDPRTGKPLVYKILRTQQSKLFEGRSPDADLMVTWNKDITTDSAESSDIGRIGPGPYFRTGGHHQIGLCIAHGPDIKSKSSLPADASILDLTTTIIKMLGKEVPNHMEGKYLF